ncbi:hypothetical protein K501DRAFT_236127 [Backusella circina FSU 941]|nr:hypothetical protein K501DRAFT_236127 [Backusella circina FSU 941]
MRPPSNSSDHTSQTDSPISSNPVLDLQQPVLPWVRSGSYPSLHSSISSDIHIVKRYVGEGAPVIPVKEWHRWTWHKMWLLAMNSLMFAYGLIILILGLCTYFKLFQRALVIVVGERTILNLVTATGIICLSTSLIGFVGIVLNNRFLLSIYNLLLWVCLGMLASIGYASYRKNKWNIEGKLSYQWHYDLSAYDRAIIQSNLHCCGYKSFSDFHETSNKCYPRTLYPGCKFKYQNFTKFALKTAYTVAFSMIPVHILVLFSALLCSNHVNNKFGKGLPPKLYHVDYKGIIAATPSVSLLDVAHPRLRQRTSS